MRYNFQRQLWNLDTISTHKLPCSTPCSTRGQLIQNPLNTREKISASFNIAQCAQLCELSKSGCNYCFKLSVKASFKLFSGSGQPSKNRASTSLPCLSNLILQEKRKSSRNVLFVCCKSSSF